MFEYIFHVTPKCGGLKGQEVVLRLPMAERESELMAALAVIYFDHEILPMFGEWRSESAGCREAVHTAQRDAKCRLETAAS